MEHKSFEFKHNNASCKGEGDFFTIDDLDSINQYYWSWKRLNSINEVYGFRRNNLPEILSEGLCSALFAWARTNATTIDGVSSSSCDLIDIESGDLIQLKACSIIKNKKPGPTSFGPRSEFDKLIFMVVDCNKDMAHFYELDASCYKNWKVNKDETLEDQASRGLRPRLVVYNKIKEANMMPFYSYNCGADINVKND